MYRITQLLGWSVILLVAVFVGHVWLGTQDDGGASFAPPAPGAAEAQLGALASFPVEEREAIRRTLDLINQGGPFPHRQDGSTFSNREGLLPPHGVGYYREYTVETPGASDRGARRIVAGGNGEIYYSDDHYGSFVRLQ